MISYCILEWIKQKEDECMNGLYLYLADFGRTIYFNGYVDLTSDFATIMENLLLTSDRIKYSYEQGRYMLSADNFVIRADEKGNVFYEFNLHELEGNEIGISLDFDFVCDFYEEIITEIRWYPMLTLETYIEICERHSLISDNVFWEKISENVSANRITKVKMYRTDELLIIERTCEVLDMEWECAERDADQENYGNQDNIVLQIIRSLEEKGEQYEVNIAFKNIEGRYEVPCLEIKTKDFSKVYHKDVLICCKQFG